MHVKRCKQCGKILVGDSKIDICPKCADKDKKGVAELILAGLFIGGIAKKAWKPGVEALKGIAKIVTKS